MRCQGGKHGGQHKCQVVGALAVLGLKAKKICLVGWRIDDNDDAMMIMKMGKMMTKMVVEESRAKMGSDFTSHGCQPER